MRLPKTAYATSPTARPSFTLVELLIVMGIISILVSLSAAAIIKAISAQQTGNAKSIIRRVDAARAERWNKEVNTAYRSSNNMSQAADGSWFALTGLAPQNTINVMAGNYVNYSVSPPATVSLPNYAKRARAIYVAYYMKRQFPQSFAEVLWCNNASHPDPRWWNPLGANPAYAKKLTALGIQANDPPLPGESTALLYMALEKGTSGPGKAADLFGSSCVKGQMFPTTNGGTAELMTFKDEWGTPYEFYRWSTFNTDLDATLPATSKSRNVLDPDNTFMNANPLSTSPTWYNLTIPAIPAKPPQLPTGYISPRLLFEQTCYSLRAGYSYPLTATAQDVPYTYYINPVVVSAGANTRLGLYLPGATQPMGVDAADPSGAFDNLYSYQLKRE